MHNELLKRGYRMTKARRAALDANPHMSLQELINVGSPASLYNYNKKSDMAGKVMNVVSFNKTVVDDVPAPVVETDEEIENRLNDRFETINTLTMACVTGDARSLIVSGPAGLGKTFSVEKTLRDWDMVESRHTIVSGYVRATGLYKMLYQNRFEGNVLVLDDADAVFYDDISLNLIKKVCDTTERRVVSWLSEAVFIDEESAERIPSSFEFNGSVIFVTNLDFDALIARGHKLAPHLTALVSRSHYIDCGMKNRRDYIVRIQQVIKQGMLSDLPVEHREEVMQFIRDNQDRLRELSLRMALKIGSIRKSTNDWKRLATITCCKN